MTDTIEVNTLRDWLESHQPVTVLDVRSVLERYFGRIPGETPGPDLEAGANRCAVR